jgi:hypothetical protein
MTGNLGPALIRGFPSTKADADHRHRHINNTQRAATTKSARSGFTEENGQGLIPTFKKLFEAI